MTDGWVGLCMRMRADPTVHIFEVRAVHREKLPLGGGAR